ncbi:SDR family oxidoreductase [Kangiella sp. HZ709]|uniref:SDR family oxidoreductase n=1 Tax=Kangiella sp. HZ709 TaxID=2666328 RepID=UPI0012AF0C6E|nr:SDR family oxidoreductase [Kangiella sp. HZ709]MRX27204.1 SDR family NAD(P)-dependent oxidoreductase [Kangiella sp. HZ709]
MKFIKYLLIISIYVISSLPGISLSYAAKEKKAQKAVLITGASSGIGKKTAEMMAKQGYFVYAGARKEKDLKALSANKNMLGVRLDVTIQEDIDKAVELIRKEGRGLHAVVNNAGVTVFGPLIEVSEQDMQFQMDVNLFGPYRVTKAFAPMIIESQGRVVNISSVAGIFTGSMVGPYNMSKFAIEAYSEVLAKELKKFGVEVSIIEPGNYNSSIIKTMKRRMQQIDTTSNSQYDKEMQRLFQYFTEDRSNHKEPVDVANAIIDAVSSESPKLRYMVVPVEQEATLTLQASFNRIIELNKKQPFEQNRKALIEMLDIALSQHK